MGPLPPHPPIMLLLLLLLLLPLAPGPGPGVASGRSHVHRRGILELTGTLRCVGPRTPIAYLNYGCYCGLGGRGQPRDAIDWCCHRHDCCYSQAEEAGCSPKMERYSWECVNQRVQCGWGCRWFSLERTGRVGDHRALCPQPGLHGPAENECQQLLCRCDAEIANCLAETQYHMKYLFYPHFLCVEDSPKCD